MQKRILDLYLNSPDPEDAYIMDLRLSDNFYLWYVSILLRLSQVRKGKYTWEALVYDILQTFPRFVCSEEYRKGTHGKVSYEKTEAVRKLLKTKFSVEEMKLMKSVIASWRRKKPKYDVVGTRIEIVYNDWYDSALQDFKRWITPSRRALP